MDGIVEIDKDHPAVRIGPFRFLQQPYARPSLGFLAFDQRELEHLETKRSEVRLANPLLPATDVIRIEKVGFSANFADLLSSRGSRDFAQPATNSAALR